MVENPQQDPTSANAGNFATKLFTHKALITIKAMKKYLLRSWKEVLQRIPRMLSPQFLERKGETLDLILNSHSANSHIILIICMGGINHPHGPSPAKRDTGTKKSNSTRFVKSILLLGLKTNKKCTNQSLPSKNSCELKLIWIKAHPYAKQPINPTKTIQYSCLGRLLQLNFFPNRKLNITSIWPNKR